MLVFGITFGSRFLGSCTGAALCSVFCLAPGITPSEGHVDGPLEVHPRFKLIMLDTHILTDHNARVTFVLGLLQGEGQVADFLFRDFPYPLIIQSFFPVGFDCAIWLEDPLDIALGGPGPAHYHFRVVYDKEVAISMSTHVLHSLKKVRFTGIVVSVCRDFEKGRVPGTFIGSVILARRQDLHMQEETLGCILTLLSADVRKVVGVPLKTASFGLRHGLPWGLKQAAGGERPMIPVTGYLVLVV
jgi:hypothetical protein